MIRGFAKSIFLAAGFAISTAFFHAVGTETALPAGALPLLSELKNIKPDAKPAPEITAPLLDSATGKVEMAPPDGAEFKPVEPGQTIPIGSTLRTGDSSAVIIPVPGTAIQIDLHTTVALTEAVIAKNSSQESKVGLDLKEGSLLNVIGRKEGGLVDYQVKMPTGTATATATGTLFNARCRNGRAAIVSLHSSVICTISETQAFIVPSGMLQTFDGKGAVASLRIADAAQDAGVRDAVRKAFALLRLAVQKGYVTPLMPTLVTDSLQNAGMK